MSFADFRGTQILGQLEFAVKDFHSCVWSAA